MPLILLLCIIISRPSWLSDVPAQADAAEVLLGGEKAFFTTPQMSPEADYRQDVCDRYTAFRNGTVELKDALRGMKLNVLMGAYNGSYFNYNPETGIDAAYPGIAATLMDELARRAGFTWRSSFGIFTDPRGADFNESWTDVLTWGVQNYDMNVDWWASNVERLNLGVVYTKPWYDSSIILVGKKEPEEIIDENIEWNDFWNWTKPFTTEVWATVFGTIFLSGLVYMLIEGLEGEVEDRTLWELFTENVYLSAINATQAYEYGLPKSFSAKIVGMSMTLWALIMTATYTANLASLLVDRRAALLVVETVEEASVFGYPICTVEGTNADTFISNAYPSASRRPATTLEDLYRGVNSGQCAFAADVVQSWLGNKNKRQYNRNCDLEWIGNGRVVTPNAAGFATMADAGFKCTGLVRDVINFHIEQMIGDETLSDAWNVENKRYQDIDCDTFRPELLDELNAAESKENDPTRRRNLLNKQNDNLANRQSFSRRLKTSKGAAAGVSAIGSGGDSEQMKLETMIGSFFIHWMLMCVAVLFALCKKIYEKIVVIRKRRIEGKEIHTFGVEDTTLYEANAESKKLHAADTERTRSFGFRSLMSGGRLMSGRLNEDLEVVSRADPMLNHDDILTDGSSLQSQIEELKYSFEKSEATRVEEHQNLQGKLDMMIQENQNLRAQVAMLIRQLRNDETRIRHS